MYPVNTTASSRKANTGPNDSMHHAAISDSGRPDSIARSTLASLSTYTRYCSSDNGSAISNGSYTASLSPARA